MTLRQPAIRWQDALPCGNGTIGALLFGNIERETVVLNHENLWLPHWERKPMPLMSRHLPKLRLLISQGRYAEAEEFWREEMLSQGRGNEWPNPFQPGCDLVAEYEPSAPFFSYKRVLDFTTGEATVSWFENDRRIARRLFVSRADGVVVLELQGIHPSVLLAPHPVGLEPGHGGIKVEGLIRYEVPAMPPGWSGLRGIYGDGSEFGAVARIIETNLGRLVLTKIYAGKETREEVEAHLSSLPADYELLLARHIKLHRELYGRVSLQIGEASLGGRSNEEIFLDAYDGVVPPALHERMFHFSRYALIASTGKLPANLQGVWNGSWRPAWSCDYTMDENIQMNYWQALPGNLPELLMPLFALWESQYADWRENARSLFDCRGLLATVRSSTHGLNHHVLKDWPWHFWISGAGWLAQTFYDYWLFTRDRDFLEKRCVPLLKEIVLFYEDFLTAGSDGRLLFSPSISPENIPNGQSCKTTVNATMDIAIAREVLAHLVKACGELGIESASIPGWEAMRNKMPPYATNADGALKEWLDPRLKDEYHHRHLSHVYPVFPGFEAFSEKNDALRKACRVAVEKRLVVGIHSQTSWSLAHMASLFARMRQPERALECLQLILRALTGPNQFTYHQDWRMSGLSIPALCARGEGTSAAFQIDAVLGFSAAVMEMLLCSTPGGELILLPALPDSWPDGRVTGLRARGGFQVDICWTEGKLLSARVESLAGMQSRVSYRDYTLDLALVKGEAVSLDADLRLTTPADAPIPEL